MAKVCLVVTKEIRELAKSFPDETPLSIANLVSLYIEDNNITDINFIPSDTTLKEYIKELRGSDTGKEYTLFDLGDNFNLLTNEAYMKYVNSLGSIFGVKITPKDGRYLELSGDYATPIDFRAVHSLLYDTVYKDSPLMKGGAQERLDAYLQWENAKRNARKLDDIKITSRIFGYAKQQIRSEVDTRTHMHHQYEAMSKLHQSTARSLSEGIASWFSDYWDASYNKFLEDNQAKLMNFRMQESLSEEQEQQLEDCERNCDMSREVFLATATPTAIFNQIKKRLTEYKNADNDALKSRLIKDFKISRAKCTDAYVGEVKQLCARALDCFDLLCENAAPLIEQKESISLTRPYSNIEITETMAQKESEDPENDFSDDIKLEENYKETWMYDYDTVSIYSKLPAQLKVLLSNCPYINRRGVKQYTVLHTLRTLPLNTTIPVLLDGMYGVTSSKDVIPALRSMAAKNPWVKTIVTKLSADSQLLTMFYINMRKAQMTYAITSVDELSGKIEMDIINRANKSGSAASEARSRLMSHNPITDRSVYKNNGKIDRTAAATRLREIKELENIRTNLNSIEVTPENGDEMKSILSSNPNAIKIISSALQAIGFYATADDVVTSVLSAPVSKSSTHKNNLSYLINCLSSIYSDIVSRGDIESADDIVRELSYDINDISEALIRPDETAVEYSVRQNGKTRYTYVSPSDLDDIIMGLKGKQFKGVVGKRLKRVDKSQIEYIEEKYCSDSYYYDQETGYRSLWLEDLAGDNALGPETIDYINVLDYTNDMGTTTEPESWDRALRAKMHYDMYHRENNRNGKNNDDADTADNTTIERWYPIPVPSDVQTARYIKFRSYSHEDLLRGYSLLIQQELDRMLSTPKLQNMPEVYINNQNKFCMLPILNNYNDKTTPETIKHLAELSTTDKATFDAELRKMATYVLNQEKIKYIRENWQFIDKNLYPGKFTQEELIALVTNDDRQEVGRIVKEKGLAGEFDLKEYIENSSYAQSQMIELFIGDPAFFKSYTDLQKRFKQIIVPKSPIDPFNKDANPNQEEELQEKAMYIADIEAASNNIEDIKKLYTNKQTEKNLSRDEKEAYAAVVKAFSNITYTDGQSYRTPRGFKKILYMNGTMRRGDELDQALDRIFSATKKGDIIDKDALDTIAKYQQSFVIKNFVSGMLSVDAGNGITKLMPVQHKTSEQLLTAALECAALTTGQSPLLKAMAEFAEENDVDVFIFNSGVKEGNNGYANVNETNVDNSTYSKYTIDELINSLKNNEIQIERLLGATVPGEFGILEEAEAVLESTDVVSNEAELARGFGNKASESRIRRKNGIEQEDALEGWAKENGLWLNDLNEANNLKTYLNTTYDGSGNIFGSESQIYIKDEKTLIKEMSLSHSDDNPRLLLDKLVWHNRLFPATKYNVIGFGRDESNHFKVIVEQPFVQGTNASVEEIEDFLKSDFDKVEGTSLWVSKDGDIQLTDLSPLNVLKSDDGQLYVIDSDIELSNKNAGVVRSNSTKAQIKQTKQSLDLQRHAIHNIPYSMWGTVSTVPEHGIDKTINIGTQPQKILAEDIPEDAKFKFEGRDDVSKQEILATYNALYTEKIMRAYKDITGVFADKYKLSRKLQEAVKNSPRGSEVLRRAFELDEYDNFIIPLGDLSTITLSSEFLNSVLRKALTKVEMPGGHFVQMSVFGMKEKLSLEFERDKDGNPTALKAIQCYLSAYSKNIVEAYMDDSGYIDPDDLPEELRNALGYRIPTASKSFIVPLHIMGFLPAVMPTTIVLPAEIVALSDSDYDVDEVHVILPSISKFNIKKARDDYFEVPGIKNAKRQAISSDLPFNFMLKALRLPTFKEWFKDHKKDYIAGNGMVEYASGRNKEISKLNEAELNNKLLECMYAMLTSPAVATQVISSGDTKPVAKAAEKVREIMNFSNEILSPASISTVITQQDRNSVGKNMISVMAVANAFHAIIEHINNTEGSTAFALKEDYRVTINGYSNLSMTGTKDRNGSLISKNIGSCLNAAADNSKNPLLYYLNIGQKTANAACLMLHLGYTIEDVGMFLNIPAIRDYVNTGEDPYYVQGYSQDERTLPGDLQDMAEAIKAGDPKSIESEEERTMYEQYNATALGIFKFLQMQAGQDMFELGQLTRSDSGSSAPHGSLENNIARILKYRQYERRNKNLYYFDGWENLFNTTDDFKEAVKNSSIPIAQALTSYGTFGSYKQLSQLYPGLQAKDFEDVMLDMLERFYGNYITPRNVKSILLDLYTYMHSTLVSFHKGSRSTEESRRWYMSDAEGEDNFINNAKALLNKYPSINNFSLIKHMIFGNKTEDLPFIDLQYDGQLVADVRDYFSREWAQMFYSPHSEIRAFAQDLYIYSFFRNGLQFTNGSFAHLAPTEARTELPGYVQELQRIMDTDASLAAINSSNFVLQYLRNHLRDKSVCRMVPSYVKSYLKNGEAMDSFTVDGGTRAGSYLQDIAKKKGCFKTYHNGEELFYIAVKQDNGDYAWYKTTPLGWGWRASEYNNTVDALTLRSVYDQERVRKNLQSKRSSSNNSYSMPAASDAAPEISSSISDQTTKEEAERAKITTETPSTPKSSASTQQTQIAISPRGYVKGDPQRRPDIDFVFTENAEAFIASHNTKWSKEKVGPYEGPVKLNVSDVGGRNQAGIRTDVNGNVSPNAYGIIVKKYQHAADGSFVKGEGQWQNNLDDYGLFIDMNIEQILRIKKSPNTKKLFPQQFALGKAALPKQFATWLQAQLKRHFKLDYEVRENTQEGYNGYGLIFRNNLNQNAAETGLLTPNTEWKDANGKKPC